MYEEEFVFYHLDNLEFSTVFNNNIDKIAASNTTTNEVLFNYIKDISNNDSFKFSNCCNLSVDEFNKKFKNSNNKIL